RRHTRFSRDWSSDVCSSDLGFKRSLHSAGNFLTKAFIVLAKVISVLFIIGACAGLVVLIISIIASFGLLGYNNGMAMFPFNVIRSEERRVGKECRSRRPT